MAGLELIVISICAVATNWGFLLVGVLIVIALLFGVYVRVSDFWKLQYEPGFCHGLLSVSLSSWRSYMGLYLVVLDKIRSD